MKNRYKIAAFFLSLFFLVLLPHNNLLNVDSALQKKTVLKSNKSAEVAQNNNPQVEAAVSPPVNLLDRDQMLEDVTSSLSKNQQFSVAVYDIYAGEYFGIDQNKGFHAASTIKTLVATTVFQKVEDGKLRLNQPLGNGTVESQISQMVNQSNNDSWTMLNNLVGFKAEQALADSLGLTGIKVSTNTMTAKGEAELLFKLYNGEVLTNENRDKLFGFMTDTETEDRITAAIPDSVTVYHKSGTFDGNVHDSAIVIHPRRPFILVIFTKDQTGLFSQEKTIQEAAGKIYQYFDQL